MWECKQRTLPLPDPNCERGHARRATSLLCVGEGEWHALETWSCAPADLITMGFDNNRDLKISVNEFGYKFIELALVQPMPIAGFNGTGLQLYEEFINEVSKRVEAQVTRLASVIDEMVAAMAARSQEIARAAFEQANMNGVAFQPQQFAAAGPFDQQHHNVFNYPGV